MIGAPKRLPNFRLYPTETRTALDIARTCELYLVGLFNRSSALIDGQRCPAVAPSITVTGLTTESPSQWLVIVETKQVVSPQTLSTTTWAKNKPGIRYYSDRAVGVILNFHTCPSPVRMTIYRAESREPVGSIEMDPAGGYVGLTMWEQSWYYVVDAVVDASWVVFALPGAQKGGHMERTELDR